MAFAQRWGIMGAKTTKKPWRRLAVLLAFAIPLRIAAQQSPGPLAIAGLRGCVHESSMHLLAQGQFKSAETELRQAFAIGPPCPEAHFLLGYTLMRQNRPSESLAEYTAAAQMQRPRSEDLRNVALDYVLLADYVDAGHWIERALVLDGNDSENWYVLGRIRYSTGKFREAVVAFTRTLDLAPASLKAENNLGLAYEGLNDAEKAIVAYRTAISLGEKSGQPSEQPMINLAILLTHRSDLDGALTLLTRAVVLAPEDVSVREHLGHVYLEKNELPLAQMQLEKAVSLSPQDARLHYLLGQVYRREGNGDKANSEFARCASLNGAHSSPDHVN
jgi:Flp pilus assembly protein TadD